MKNKPIGLLDSGAGGLTVLKAVKERLPNESFVYVGDTARCPYGNKTNEEIIRYTLEMVQFLIKKDVKMIVIACNTATAQALETVRKKVSVPVIGVITPGSEAAALATRSQRIGVLATESTVNSGFYEKTIHDFNPTAEVDNLACPTFVDMVEDNNYRSEEARIKVKEELRNFKKEDMDTVILGCTHFPLLAPFIQEAMGDNVTLIDSGSLTSLKVENVLKKDQILADETTEPTIALYSTNDSVALFKQIATDWMNMASLDVQSIVLEKVADE